MFEAYILQYRYTFSGLKFEGSFWDELMTDRMKRLTRLQLYQIKPTERPPGAFADGTFRHLKHAFEKPSTWKYYDEKIPEWYEAWKKRASKRRDMDDSDTE